MIYRVKITRHLFSQDKNLSRQVDLDTTKDKSIKLGKALPPENN